MEENVGDITYFAKCLPDFIRLQPFAGLRLGEIPYEPNTAPAAHEPFIFKTASLENTDVLCVHGVEDGALYHTLLPWLKENPARHVFFLEEDPQVLLKLLHTELGVLILSHPQMGLYWLEGGESQRLLLTQLTWDFFGMRWHFMAYKTSISLLETHQRLYEQLEGIHLHAQTLAKELLTHGELYFTNFYANLPKFAESGCGDWLFSRFAGLPIIICGSGPSLQSQLPLLKNLSDRALIIGAGSAVAVLLAHGIVPHFGVAIDPTLSQAERIEGQIGLSIPYFYRPRIHPRALPAIRGQKLYVCGAGAYEAPLHIERALKLPAAQVDEGHNVLHFALSIAERLQGRGSRKAPLILLGADGAYSQTAEYSPGIPTSSRKPDEEAHLKTTREDLEGHLLVTRKQWLAERAWFAQYAEKHPKTLIINASAGGLPIEGLPHLPLSKCIARYCKQTVDLSGRVWAELQKVSIPAKGYLKIARLLDDWKKSLERIQNFMHTAELALKEGYPHLVPYAEAAWQSESAYGPILALFERIITRLQNVEEKRAQALEAPMREKKQQELFLKRLTFLQQGAGLHLGLLGQIDLERIKESYEAAIHKDSPQLQGRDRTHAIQSKPKGGKAEPTAETKTLFTSNSGIVLAEGHFQNALRQGTQRHYYANGMLAWEGNYEAGTPVGLHRTFSPNGGVKQMIDYSQGKVMLYDEAGTCVHESPWPSV